MGAPRWAEPIGRRESGLLTQNKEEGRPGARLLRSRRECGVRRCEGAETVMSRTKWKRKTMESAGAKQTHRVDRGQCVATRNVKRSVVGNAVSSKENGPVEQGPSAGTSAGCLQANNLIVGRLAAPLPMIERHDTGKPTSNRNAFCSIRMCPMGRDVLRRTNPVGGEA